MSYPKICNRVLAETKVDLRGVFLALVAFFGGLSSIAGLLWCNEAGDVLFRQPLLLYSSVLFVFALAGFVVLAANRIRVTITLMRVMESLFMTFGFFVIAAMAAMTVTNVYEFKSMLGVAMAHSAWIATIFLMTLGALGIQRRIG